MELTASQHLFLEKSHRAVERIRRFLQRRPYLIEAACCALIFSLAYLLRIAVFSAGDYSYLGGDENWYLRLTRRISNEGVESVYFWLPGWPYILSMFTKMGFDIPLIRNVVMGIASLNCILVFLIGYRLWGRATGMAAALVMALFPEHVFFSHYLYAEIGLEFIVLMFTFFFVCSFSSNRALYFFSIASLIIGAGLLYKHFAVIPFLAAAALWLAKGHVKIFLSASVLFFLPLLVFSVYLKVHGQNPLFWFDSPLKSAREWDRNRIGSHFKPNRRNQALSHHIRRLKDKSFGKFAQKSSTNFYRLWVPNLYVINRIRWGLYRTIKDSLFTARLVYAGYLIIVFFGVAGLIFGPNDSFKFYCAANVVILSAMSGAMFLVSRYHVPFMFIFALYTGYMITHARFTRLWSNADLASLKAIEGKNAE